MDHTRKQNRGYSEWALLLVLAPILFLCPHTPAQQCPSVSSTLPAKELPAYERLIRLRMRLPRRAGRLQLGPSMREGRWSVLFAASERSERGIFFFRQARSGPVLAGVWGGVAGTDSLDSIAQWASALSADFPPPLARCFAQAVVAGN